MFVRHSGMFVLTETLFCGDGSGHVICGGSLFTWSAGLSALSNLEGVGRAFNTFWSSISSSRARGAHHYNEITSLLMMRH